MAYYAAARWRALILGGIHKLLFDTITYRHVVIIVYSNKRLASKPCCHHCCTNCTHRLYVRILYVLLKIYTSVHTSPTTRSYKNKACCWYGFSHVILLMMLTFSGACIYERWAGGRATTVRGSRLGAPHLSAPSWPGTSTHRVWSSLYNDMCSDHRQSWGMYKVYTEYHTCSYTIIASWVQPL